MVFDARDEIWDGSHNTYYDAFYEEIMAEKIINRWQLLDEISKITIALTASGSALSGWSLWNDPNFKGMWVILAGFGAVVAIIHSSLNVPGRLRDWGETKRGFASLRIELETFMYKMKFNAEFPLNEYEKEFIKYRKKYGEGIQQLKSDILWTKDLEKEAQVELNERVNYKNGENNGN